MPSFTLILCNVHHVASNLHKIEIYFLLNTLLLVYTFSWHNSRDLKILPREWEKLCWIGIYSGVAVGYSGCVWWLGERNERILSKVQDMFLIGSVVLSAFSYVRYVVKGW